MTQKTTRLLPSTRTSQPCALTTCIRRSIYWFSGRMCNCGTCRGVRLQRVSRRRIFLLRNAYRAMSVCSLILLGNYDSRTPVLQSQTFAIQLIMSADFQCYLPRGLQRVSRGRIFLLRNAYRAMSLCSLILLGNYDSRTPVLQSQTFAIQLITWVRIFSAIYQEDSFTFAYYK
jgi:hypothetical protein